jgi:hypothetical protein
VTKGTAWTNDTHISQVTKKAAKTTHNMLIHLSEERVQEAGGVHEGVDITGDRLDSAVSNVFQ